MGEAWEYYFGSEYDQPAGDIYLPFETPGIGDPETTSLSLVAFAPEENALRLWATIPNRNVADSDQVSETAYGGFHTFALTQWLSWNSLGDGGCPNVVQSVSIT